MSTSAGRDAPKFPHQQVEDGFSTSGQRSGDEDGDRENLANAVDDENQDENSPADQQNKQRVVIVLVALSVGVATAWMLCNVF